MKAKEIVDKLKGWESNPDILTTILLEMLDETADIIDKRNCQEDIAFVAVYREQQQKWEAVRRIIPALPKNGFRVGVEAATPKMYEALKKYKVFDL